MSKQDSYTALATLAASGNSANIACQGNENEVTIYVGTNATWGGGTAVIAQSFDGGTTWFNVPNASWTAGVANTQLGRVTVYGNLIRVTLSGATTPSLDFRIKVETVAYRNVSKPALLTANGSTDAFTISDVTSNFPVTTTSTPANVVAWSAQGTWGSGTLALQTSPDGGTTWFNVGTTLTANGLLYTAAVTDQLCRFTLSGATNPSLQIAVVL